MIWHVARRELLENVRSARFLAMCLLALLLLPLSAHVNAAQYAQRQQRADALRAAQQRRVSERTTEGSAYASRYGWRGGEVIADPALRAVRAPSRFAILAMGSEASLPAYWQFSTEGVEAGPATGGEGSPAAGMDAVFIVQTILGLLALLLVFDAISGERDSGVLRLLLAAPVRRADLLLGKAVGAALTLAVPLALGLAGALAVVELSGVSLLRDGALVRLAIFAAASALYLCTMLAIGLAVSATTSRPSTSWVALLLIWIGVVLVLPRGSEMIAATVQPPLAAFEVRQAKLASIRPLEAERARVLQSGWRRLSGADSVPVEAPASVRLAYRSATSAEARRFAARKRALIAEADQRRARGEERRRRLARRIAWLSPAAAYERIASGIAETGVETARRWERQVAEHQLRLERESFDRTFGMELFPERLGFLRIIWWPDPSDPGDRPPDYSALPVFAYRPAPLTETITSALPELAVLTFGSVVSLVVAMAAFQRADVQ